MKTFMGLLVVLMLSATSHALDIKDLTQSPGDKSSVTSADLVASLVEERGVTGTQASGGTSALVAMAANNLSGENAGKLQELIPGDWAGGLTTSMVDGLSNMEGVKNVFEQLGMDPALIGQFTPVILEYLGSNGGGELLAPLAGLWGG